MVISIFDSRAVSLEKIHIFADSAVLTILFLLYMIEKANFIIRYTGRDNVKNHSDELIVSQSEQVHLAICDASEWRLI